jgi:acyl-CoA thioesterase
VEANFSRDTAVRELEPGLFEGSVNRDWWIVFGPNGGFVAALLMRAMTTTVADDSRTPRSLTVHYTAAPREGSVRIRTTLERAGRTMTTVTARMTQDERLVAIAAAAFSAPRNPVVEFADAPPPDVPPPEQVETVAPHPEQPPFAHQWEVKPALGDPLFSGAARALAGGWIRLHEPEPLDGALVAQLTDAWIPPIFTRLREPNPVPTIDLTVHFRAALPLPADWVLGRFETRLSSEGFVEEDGEIWSRDGRLVAQSRQLAVLQGPSHK